MALEILYALIKEQPISHQVHHDLESFAWVIAYSFGRFHATKKRPTELDAKEYEAFFQHFRQSFGHSRVTEVAKERSGNMSALTTQVAPQLFSDPLMVLFDDLSIAIEDSNRHLGRRPGALRNNRASLSYEIFFGFLDAAITSLQT